MKIGFTGTSDWVEEIQLIKLEELLLKFSPKEFHHGDCIIADEKAHNVVRKLYSKSNCSIHIHPPIKENKRAFCTGDYNNVPKEYLARNKDIVTQTSTLIAIPKGLEVLRSGTWSTIRYARKIGRPIYTIYPDGQIITG